MANRKQATPLAAASPDKVETAVTTESALRQYNAALSTFKGGEMLLLGSAVATFILCCHLQPADKRSTVASVTEAMETMVKAVTGVKRSQSKLYTGLAAKAYNRIVRTQAFGGVIAELAAMSQADVEAGKAAERIVTMFRQSGDKRFPDGITNLEHVRIAFGGKPRRGNQGQKAHERVAATIGTAIAGAEPEDRDTVTREFASAIVDKSPDAVAFILACASELDSENLSVLADKLADVLKQREAAAKASPAQVATVEKRAAA